MSNFPYALPKQLIGDGTVATTGDSGDLTALDLGMFDKNTHVVVTSGNAASHPYVYLAQGSAYSVDALGNTPLGRLKESIKTNGINAKYVTRFYKIASQAAAAHILRIGGATALNFESDKTYTLRVEAKGSPALRMLNRQLYKHVPFFTGCASSDCLAGCDKEYVDPASVYLGWATYINRDPLLSQLVVAAAYKQAAATTMTNTGADAIIVVADATGIVVGQLAIGAGITPGTTVASISGTSITLSAVTTVISGGTAVTFNTPVTSSYTPSANSTTAFTTIAFMTLNAAYVDTSFSTCVFDPIDFYQKEPIILYASLVDSDGNPCTDGPKINSNTSENTVELQAPVSPEGVGETVIRDYILSRQYEGIRYSTDARFREVEKDPIFSVVDKTKLFTRYYLQFHVPVFSNPSNTFSSTQYLVSIAFESTVSVSAFETLMAAWLTANNPSVSLETIV